MSTPPPKQRVRVPMPSLTPMTDENGVVTVPWMYYLMQPGRELYESTGWTVATCDPLEAGTDISVHLPAYMPGTLSAVTYVAKDPPDSGGADAVLDIEKSADGVSWASIFGTGGGERILLPTGVLGVGIQYNTFDGTEKRIATGDQFRLNCITPGTNTMNLAIKIFWLVDEFDSTSAITTSGPERGYNSFPGVLL